MPQEVFRDPALEWLDHVQPVGLVVSSAVLKDLILEPIPQRQTDTADVGALIDPDVAKPGLADPWAFFETVLGWEARMVAGAPGGPAVPDTLSLRLPEHDTTLSPDWAVADPAGGETPWQLLVRLEKAGIDPDRRGALGGWEATPHQRFERLLRETGVYAGVMITDRDIRLVYAPKGETSGWLAFPIRPLATVAGRVMLGGLKLMLDRRSLFTDAPDRRLPAVLQKSRDAQAAVSTSLAEQVLGALHELLRGLVAADPAATGALAKENPGHLYEGLLTVMLRLVFVLYAEDRDLLPSRTDDAARTLYDNGYSARGLYARLTEDAALNPDTMDERRGGWGRLLALFRLIHRGHKSGLVQARGGKLFDPDAFPFLEGRERVEDAPRVLPVSDGCILRILEGLMTLAVRGGARERLSYRTLDVEQIGSVYETVMGFKAQIAEGRSLAIKAGKNNRTPVFVDLDRLADQKGKDRVKFLKDEADRGQLPASVAKTVEAAKDAAALATALDAIVDERGSPKKHAIVAGTPILQPTDERRRTGSHYTPRSLTEPIVRYALEPAFDRLGPDATPEQILDLNVCDPAMGSGAFLVEACRALATRLVAAWARCPDKRPAIPADEDEELHARRLVAQRCLYGVDKNPLAVDLAKLSLWLATLARDHEFTFLDHALKSGDSLVGLTRSQIAATHWDASKPPTFVGKLVSDHLREAEVGRREIRERAEFEDERALHGRLRGVEAKTEVARLIGDGIIAAFFAEEKQKKRIEKLVTFQKTVQSHLGGRGWTEACEPYRAGLRQGPHPLTPFHWEIEFPEVFGGENAGFDAIVGNPPFLGGKSISTNFGDSFSHWLETCHPGGTRSADLVAHFFRRAFNLVRLGGAFGLIATNTIGQGDTRDTGLAKLLEDGGIVIRAMRRLKWPGEAAVVVSVIHVIKGGRLEAMLDGRRVSRISAYLVEGFLDSSPATLAANEKKAFVGSYVLGVGFTFDDAAAADGAASSLNEMHRLIAKDARNAQVIFPYIGGEEVSTNPRHAHHRYAINFFDRPLGHRSNLRSWMQMTASEQAECLTCGLVPQDYPGEVAENWPDLLEDVRRMVKPERDVQKRKALRERWWQYADKRPGLYSAIRSLPSVLVTGAAAVMHHMIASLPSDLVFSHKTIVFALSTRSGFASLQCSIHELWSRTFGTTFGSVDALTYNPTQVFRTFPFPADFERDVRLEHVGRTYHNHRAALMVARNEGMTKTYNRFHDRTETAEDIRRLRELHAAMDRAVLEAYAAGAGNEDEAQAWRDLAARAEPIFLDETNEDDHTYQGRLFWPSDFRDEVLARLLALNAERHADEVRRGVAPGMKGKVVGTDDDQIDEDGDENE